MRKKFLILLLLLYTSLFIGCANQTKVSFINIELDTLEIEVGDDISLNIQYDGKGDYSDLDFILSENNIIEITNNIINGKNPGIVNLTITSKKDKNISDNIIIYVNPEGYEQEFVRVSSPTNSLIVGNSMEIYVDNLKSLNATGNDDFIFSVSDPTVLQLNDDYTITALQNGVCNVEARQKNAPGNLGILTIYVGLQSDDKTSKGEPENTQLITYFDDNNYVIDAAIDEQLNILGAIDYQRYVYTSDDENILLISDTGLFMGVSEGEAIVSIFSKDSQSDLTKTTIKVKVTGERKRDYVPLLLEIALAEEGYREWTNNNDTKYGEWNNCNYEAWCATFVSWCLNNAGVPKSIAIRSISVRVYESTYRTRNQFYLKGEYQPQPGDLIIFSSAGASHIGIVVKSDETTVYTIEGNTSNMVAQRSYSLDYEQITGYIKPNYNE